MANSNGWKGFSNVPLSTTNKKAAKALKWDGAQCLGYLEMMAAGGYRMTISQDPESTAYTVSATGKDGANENAGMTMTQRHNDLKTAIMAHSVAHLQVCNEAWPDPMKPLIELDW